MNRSPVRSSRPFLWMVRSVLRTIAKLDVRGAEHVPRSGPCLVVFNQRSLFDTPLLRIAVPRPDVAGLVALEYRSNPLFRYLVERGGGIWIERGAGDRHALETALEALGRGWAVGISPEGRRSRSGGLERGKPGAAALARRAGVPIVPMAITGMDQLSSSLKRLRRARVIVRFGAPFTLPPPQGLSRKREREQAVDLIMTRIAALLPHDYRGLYADHPEVREVNPT